MNANVRVIERVYVLGSRWGIEGVFSSLEKAQAYRDLLASKKAYQHGDAGLNIQPTLIDPIV